MHMHIQIDIPTNIDVNMQTYIVYGSTYIHT